MILRNLGLAQGPATTGATNNAQTMGYGASAFGVADFEPVGLPSDISQ
jgi:hypothetical protein